MKTWETTSMQFQTSSKNFSSFFSYIICEAFSQLQIWILKKYRILRVPVLSDSVIVWTRPRFSWKGKLSEVITDTLKNLRICYCSIWTSRSHFQSVVGLWWWVKWTFVGNSDLHFENLSANHHHQKPKNLEPMFFQVITSSCNHLGCPD